MNILKPCPFCGQKPTLRQDHSKIPGPIWEVVCTEPNCILRNTRYSLTLEEAIERWNTRLGVENNGSNEEKCPEQRL